MEIFPTPRPAHQSLAGQTNGATSTLPSQPIVRAVGPGRLERGYQLQIARLSREMESLQGGYQRIESELEIAHLVERGTARFVDRIESRLEREQAQAKRLFVLVGSLQRENERLCEQIDQLRANQLRIESRPERVPFWKRLGWGWLLSPTILPGRTA